MMTKLRPLRWFGSLLRSGYESEVGQFAIGACLGFVCLAGLLVLSFLLPKLLLE